MLSNFMIVGRLLGKPEIRLKDDLEEAFISVMVRNPFPDENGNEGEECVEISLWRGIADECCDLLKEGDIIAVKGRIGGYTGQTKMPERHPCLIGEKVSYI